MRWLVALLVLVWLTAPAAAQPSSPPRAAGKSTTTALALSAAPVLLAGVAFSVAIAAQNDDIGIPCSIAGGALILIGPSLGHWYAHNGWTTGLALRLAGAASTLGAGVLAFRALIDEQETGPTTDALLLTGAGLALAGTIFDLARADDSARAYNRRLQLTPLATRDSAGLALRTHF